MSGTATATSGMRLTGLTERTFGVEMEVIFSQRKPEGRSMDAIRTALRAAGVAVEGEQNHWSRSIHADTHNGWKVVYDGSVPGGCEVVSPKLAGADGIAQVELVCRTLHETCRVRINRRCGLHVHHGASDLTVGNVKTLVRTMARFVDVLNGLLPPSRRTGGYDNTYAQGFRADELQRIERAKVVKCDLGAYDEWAARGEGSHADWRRCRSRAHNGSGSRTPCMACAAARYRTLNLRALHQHGTVEFRQHSGTVEAAKVVAWVLFTQGIVEKAKVGRGRRTVLKANGDGLKNLLRLAGLQDCRPHKQVVDPQHKERVAAVAAYFYERARHFGLIDLNDNATRRSRGRRADDDSRQGETARDRVQRALEQDEEAAQ